MNESEYEYQSLTVEETVHILQSSNMSMIFHLIEGEEECVAICDPDSMSIMVENLVDIGMGQKNINYYRARDNGEVVITYE